MKRHPFLTFIAVGLLVVFSGIIVLGVVQDDRKMIYKYMIFGVAAAVYLIWPLLIGLVSKRR